MKTSKQKINSHIVVMIPAFNEEASIGSVIKAIPREFAKTVEVIVIDDGSTDSTKAIAKKSGADRIISHNTNKGLGNTFRTGIDAALSMGADIIVNIDGDGQFDPSDIPNLVKPILDCEADATTCTRFGSKDLIPEMPLIKKFGNYFFTSFINFLTWESFSDTLCWFPRLFQGSCDSYEFTF